MKRIFLLSAMIISSFGMMNLQTVNASPAQQSAQNNSPYVNAKKLVSRINVAVSLRGDQFGKVNDACVEYYKQLDALTKSNPADLAAQTTALKQTRDAKIKAALSADQQKSWAAFKE